MTKLIVPNNCTFLNCTNNQLFKLIVPKNIQYFIIENNKLSKLIKELLSSNDPIKIELANNIQ